MIHVKPTPSISIALFSLALFLAAGAAAQTQAGPAPANHAAESQTDIAVSGYEALNSATTAVGVTQTPANSAGGMFELRHIHSPLIGYELTFGMNKENETIGPTANCQTANPTVCNLPAEELPAYASLVGANWVVSKKIGNLRPFLAAGLGLLIDEPTTSAPVGVTASSTTSFPVNDVMRPSYLYGGGVDFAITAHLGVRTQLRGAMYKVPNLSKLFPAQGVYTQTVEPMGGIFYRF